MSYGRAVLVTRILGLILAATYTIAAMAVVWADWSPARKTVGIALLGGGAVLILLGQRRTFRWPTLAPILACVGAALGGLALLPLILPPLVAALFVAMTIALARQPAPVA
jgi:hypothetical protein